MEILAEGFREAWRLIVSGDEQVVHAVYVTLVCSLTAVTLAAVAAIPFGAWLGIHRRRGQGLMVFLMRVGMFTPTVVVGLFVYGLVTRQGLLGSLDLLYTKTAIIMGEFLLAFPLIVVLVHGAVSALDPVVAETARTLGAGRFRVIHTVVGEIRVALVSAYLAGLARCLSELGVALAVGGGIRLRTRTLSSSITLEISQGDFGRGMSYGIILMVLAVGAALLAHRLSREARR